MCFLESIVVLGLCFGPLKYSKHLVFLATYSGFGPLCCILWGSRFGVSSLLQYTKCGSASCSPIVPRSFVSRAVASHLHNVDISHHRLNSQKLAMDTDMCFRVFVLMEIERCWNHSSCTHPRSPRRNTWLELSSHCLEKSACTL